ncbi:MAG: nucleotidyltransferase domain-containing protein [Deltaproteobacteria bacterium]|nr:nucleotidyltransferase domain-containing protein [Deltaproteobacteria bacterium]
MNKKAKEVLTTLEQDVLDRFIKKTKDTLPNDFLKAILFGSRARGESHEDSDVDVLVLLRTHSIKNKYIVWNIASDLFLETEINISPLVMSNARFDELRDRERLLAQDIDREGIAL